MIYHTIYKVLRSAGGIRRPLRLLRKETWCEADKGPRLIASTNWRLKNAKSPAAMPQENNPDGTRMRIPRMYLVSCCIFDVYMYVCLEACDYTELLSLG